MSVTVDNGNCAVDSGRQAVDSGEENKNRNGEETKEKICHRREGEDKTLKLNERICCWIRVIGDFICSFRGSSAKILTPAETVDLLLQGKSLIRFGDGEFGIFKGSDIHYQVWSEALKERFEKIKKDFSSSAVDCRYLLAVPMTYMSCTGFKLMKKRVLVSSWSGARRMFMTSYPQNVTYGDAFLFAKGNEPIYAKLWERAAWVVFVHRDPAYANAFRQKYKKEVAFVACPSRNAFESVDEIEQSILVELKNRAWDFTQGVVLISAGPAGKVIVYDLSAMQIPCIDTGHCWDEPLENI